MRFDLSIDVDETTDVAADHPDEVAELMKHIEFARNDIGDYNKMGKNARFFDPEPRRPDIGNPNYGRKINRQKTGDEEDEK